jgi:hypothetical protein
LWTSFRSRLASSGPGRCIDSLRNLRRIELNDCYKLREISALAVLPQLEYVGLHGVPYVDPEILRNSTASRARLVVEHDPYTASGQASS